MSQGRVPTSLLSGTAPVGATTTGSFLRKAELLLSSKNTTSLLNKHRGSCEIKQQHRKPWQRGPGDPDLQADQGSSLRWSSQSHFRSPLGSQGQGQALDGGQCLGLKAQGGRKPWREGVNTLAGCCGGGAFAILFYPLNNPAKKVYSCLLSLP